MDVILPIGSAFVVVVLVVVPVVATMVSRAREHRDQREVASFLADGPSSAAMTSDRLAISFGSGLSVLMRLLGCGPRSSRVELGEDTVTVRMGWAFRAALPRDAVVDCTRRPDGTKVRGWGAHGWRHRWLVNGSSQGLVTMHLDPMQPGRTLCFPLRLRELTVSLEEPDRLLTALAPSVEAPGGAGPTLRRG